MANLKAVGFRVYLKAILQGNPPKGTTLEPMGGSHAVQSVHPAVHSELQHREIGLRLAGLAMSLPCLLVKFHGPHKVLCRDSAHQIRWLAKFEGYSALGSLLRT